MNSLFAVELRKLWGNRKFLLFTLLLLLCNFVVLSYETWGQNTVPVQAYQTLSTKLQKTEPAQRHTFITQHAKQVELQMLQQSIQNLKAQHDPQADLHIAAIVDEHPELNSQKQIREPLYTGNLEAEMQFMDGIVKQADTVAHYPDFLNTVMQKADTISTISIFSQADGFSSRNIQKSKTDYASMRDVNISFQIQDGILRALTYPITALLLLLSLVFVSTMVLAQEKDRGLLALIYGTPRGAQSILHARLLVLMVSSALLTLLFYAGNLLFMRMAYGPVDVTASLQSLAAFQQSVLPVSISEFLVLFLVLKCIVCLLFAELVLLLCHVTRHRLSCYLGVAALLVLSWIMHSCISMTSDFRVLYYLNPIRLFQVTDMLQNYVNFNILQQPVSLYVLYTLLLIIVFTLLLVTLHTAMHQALQKRFVLPLPAWLRHLRPSCSKNLFLQECYKFLWIQKAAVILLLFAGLQLYNFYHMQLYPSQEERMWTSYMQNLEGPLTKEKETFLKQEKTYFTDLHKQEELLQKKLEAKEINMSQYRMMAEPISAMLQREEIFQKILQEYEYIRKQPTRQFVTPFAYRHQFFQTDLWTTVLFLFLFVLSISNLQCVEYRQQRQILLQATVHAKRALIVYKLLLGIVCGCLLFVTALLPQLLLHETTYGFHCLQASITSLAEFAVLPAGISIACFMVTAFLLKLLAILPVLLFCYCISVRYQNQLFTLLSATLLFLFPLLLSAAGIHWFDTLSLQPLLFNESYMTSVSGLWNLFGSLLGYGLLAMGCCYVASHAGKRCR